MHAYLEHVQMLGWVYLLILALDACLGLLLFVGHVALCVWGRDAWLVHSGCGAQTQSFGVC